MSAAPAAISPEWNASREQIMRWRNAGPALFAQEALGLPAEWDDTLKEGVLPWQWEASKAIAEDGHVSIRSGHRVGKSALMSWTILWFMSCYFPCKIGCTAPTATQMNDVLWAELALWHRRLCEKMPGLGKSFKWKTDGFVLEEAPSEAFAVARTARPESPEALQGLHSKHTLVLVDEASGVHDKVFEAGRGTLAAEGAIIMMASNPTRRDGMFFDTHNKLRPLWKTIQVNGELCPTQSQKFRDDIIYQYGKDSNVYRIRVTGDFPLVEDDVVIPMHLCTEATVREVESFGVMVWGLDVSRFGGDRTVLVKRTANATTEVHQSWSGMDTMQTAGRVYNHWLDTPAELKPLVIMVDVIGIGAGVCDRLGELGLPVEGINVAETASVDAHLYHRQRDELWFQARRWLERKDCKLFPDDVLIAELSMPKYKYTSSGKLLVETKDEMKKRYPRSPDVADAFVLTFAQVAQYRGAQSFDPEYAEDY